MKGASKGEGLGNKFLSHIKEVDLILHVIRCFDNPDIDHVEDSLDTLRDMKIVEDELGDAGLYDKVWQAYAAVGDDKAVGVVGDERKYGNIVMLSLIHI